MADEFCVQFVGPSHLRLLLSRLHTLPHQVDQGRRAQVRALRRYACDLEA